MIVDEENAGQYYPDFAFNHPLFSESMRIYSDSKVCRFLKSVTKDQMIGFLDDWNETRDHKQRIYISYDLMLTSHVFPTQTKMRHQSPAMNDGANYLCTLKKRQNFGSGF